MDVPFHINVTHPLACDADVIEYHITRVPYDAAEKEPVEENFSNNLLEMDKNNFFTVKLDSLVLGSYFFALRGVMLKGGPGGPMDLGKISTHSCNRPWIQV